MEQAPIIERFPNATKLQDRAKVLMVWGFSVSTTFNQQAPYRWSGYSCTRNDGRYLLVFEDTADTNGDPDAVYIWKFQEWYPKHPRKPR